MESDIVRLQVKRFVREFFGLRKLFLTGVKACQRGVGGGRLGINGQGLLIDLLSRGGVLLERIKGSQRKRRLETFRIEFASFLHRLECLREILLSRIDIAQYEIRLHILLIVLEHRFSALLSLPKLSAC